MELREKRKSLRLTLKNSFLKTAQEIIPISNISLDGLNLAKTLPLKSKVQGELVLNNQSLGLCQVLIVNHQGTTSGGEILNALEIPRLKEWFNPLSLMSQIMPTDMSETFLTYEDGNKCQFKFHFNDFKKIEKVSIQILDTQVMWDDSGWSTYSHQTKDGLVDGHKLLLIKNMIIQGQTFPQSFKDWLIELF